MAWRWAGIGSWLLVIVVAGAMVTVSCPSVQRARGRALGPGSLLFGLSRMVTWRRASGVAMGRRW